MNELCAKTAVELRNLIGEKEISAVASSVRKAEQMVAAQLLIELEKSS